MAFINSPLSLIAIRPQRKIGDISVQVVISENTTDKLTITKQPVQQGASITDHAYLEPTVFSCSIYFQESLSKTLSEIYQDLLDLQGSRIPFDIITPKRVYRTMLMDTLTQTTDKNTENTLAITMSCQEVILVPVTTVGVDKTRQSQPKTTGATQKAGKKSFLATLKEGITGAFGKAVP